MFGSLRGYAGEINPAAALDAVSTENNTYIIDIRTSREKENGGLPDLPSSSRWGTHFLVLHAEPCQSCQHAPAVSRHHLSCTLPALPHFCCASILLTPEQLVNRRMVCSALRHTSNTETLSALQDLLYSSDWGQSPFCACKSCHSKDNILTSKSKPCFCYLIRPVSTISLVLRIVKLPSTSPRFVLAQDLHVCSI